MLNEWMLSNVWQPPNFQHIGLSNMQPTRSIVQHLPFGQALRDTYSKESVDHF